MYSSVQEPNAATPVPHHQPSHAAEPDAAQPPDAELDATTPPDAAEPNATAPPDAVPDHQPPDATTPVPVHQPTPEPQDTIINPVKQPTGGKVVEGLGEELDARLAEVHDALQKQDDVLLGQLSRATVGIAATLVLHDTLWRGNSQHVQALLSHMTPQAIHQLVIRSDESTMGAVHIACRWVRAAGPTSKDARAVLTVLLKTWSGKYARNDAEITAA